MSNWLVDFESEFVKHYDTPDEFLQIVGYLAAGAALANRVYLRSPGELTTNLYIILISPPGWYHKSSPANETVKMLKGTLPVGEFLPSNASSEAIAKLISTSVNGTGLGHGIMVYDELATFLMHVRKEYAANIKTIVTERFEQGIDLHFARKKEGSVEMDTIPGGFVLSFIASSTTPWLLENMKGSDVTGGLLSRFLIVEAHEKTRKYPLPTPVNRKNIGILGRELDRVRNQYKHSEFFFDRDAIHIYKMLYHDIERGAMGHGHPEYPSLVSRAPTYVKKLALIHAAMAERETPFITADDLEVAAELVVRSIKSCEGLIDEAVAGDGVYSRGLLRVRKILMARGRMPKRELLRAMHIRVRELDEIIDSLSQQGIVVFDKEGKQEVLVWRG